MLTRDDNFSAAHVKQLIGCNSFLFPYRPFFLIESLLSRFATQLISMRALAPLNASDIANRIGQAQAFNWEFRNPFRKAPRGSSSNIIIVQYIKLRTQLQIWRGNCFGFGPGSVRINSLEIDVPTGNGFLGHAERVKGAAM